MKKNLLKILALLLMFILFIPHSVVAEGDESQIIRKTTTNYFTTIRLEGTFTNEYNGVTENYNMESQEITGNFSDAAVLEIINDYKENFNDWADSKQADTKEVKDEGITEYYYNVHDEITQENNSGDVIQIGDIDDIYQNQGQVTINTILDKHQIYTIRMNAVKKDKRIKEINVTVTIPTIGDEITAEEDDWGTQGPQANITLPSGVKYALDSDDGNYMYYTDSLEHSTPYSGTFERGKTYYMEIWFKRLEDYVFTENTKIIINGKELQAEGSNSEALSVVYEFTPQDKIYEILDGANQTIKTGYELTVRASGELSKLVEIRVDGKVVEPKFYKLTSGSTIATLSSSYLNTLSAGTHTLRYVYTDGYAETTFNIVKINNPQTGDNILMYVAISSLSLIGLLTFTKINKEN